MTQPAHPRALAFLALGPSAVDLLRVPSEHSLGDENKDRRRRRRFIFQHLMVSLSVGAKGEVRLENHRTIQTHWMMAAFSCCAWATVPQGPHLNPVEYAHIRCQGSSVTVEGLDTFSPSVEWCRAE